MPISLPKVDEPLAIKWSLNESSRDVREATLRQASDIVTPLYQVWKGDLQRAGLTWQAFQSAASMNHGAWRGWLNGDIPWHGALDLLVQQLNGKIPGKASLQLCE